MRLSKVGLAIAGVVTAALALTACSETGSTSSSTSAGASGSASSCTKAAPSTVASSSAAASSAAASAPASSAASSAPAAAAGAAGLVEKGEGGSLTIGVKFDQPGLGLKAADGTMSGFDVEVAKYVAKKLGVEESGITWKETPSAQRETALQNQEVDLIAATYSITDKRLAVVDFAGPYFVAHQDLLVKSDNSTICGPNDLNGKLLCSVKGSTSAQRIKDTFAADVQLKEYGGYSDCIQALKTGAVDAVTTDDVILAGYAAQSPNDYKVVGNGFSNENYGIGIHKGDTAGAEAVSAALAEMISDGSWKKALTDTVGPSGYTIPAPPTPSAQAGS
jgi:glutamate transport system substrate-binding protein